MIVAVSGVNMVQPAIDEIIDMIAMRHGFVAAIRPMHVATGQFGRATIGIGGRHCDHMFINMIAVNMVKMAVMQIIHMTIVVDSSVATARAVDMRMIEVDVAAHLLAFQRNGRNARQRLSPPLTTP